MGSEPLVVTTREVVDASAPVDGRVDEASIENVHFGSIAVVSPDGALLHVAGDPDHWTFTRSSLKPFQALPFIRDGGHERLGWGAPEIAMMCASHSGEAMHVERVASMLSSIDCSEDDLRCGCHVPGWYAALHRRPPPDLSPSPLEHNCSGKHAGFLAACRACGQDVKTYLDPQASVQTRVVDGLAGLTGQPRSTFGIGTDGCSAPNVAMPLVRLAHLFAQLACGTEARQADDAMDVLFDAMTAHPELVSGTARSDLALMSRAPRDWVTKIGADGVQGIGVRSRGYGIAIKIADGSRDALYCALGSVLLQLGLVDVSDLEPAGVLAMLAPRPLRNARGLVTGRMHARFTLRPA